MPFNGFMNIVHFTLLATHCIDIDIEKDACPGVSLFAASDEYTETMFPHQWEMLYQVRFHLYCLCLCVLYPLANCFACSLSHAVEEEAALLTRNLVSPWPQQLCLAAL